MPPAMPVVVTPQFNIYGRIVLNEIFMRIVMRIRGHHMRLAFDFPVNFFPLVGFCLLACCPFLCRKAYAS